MGRYRLNSSNTKFVVHCTVFLRLLLKSLYFIEDRISRRTLLLCLRVGFGGFF